MVWGKFPLAGASSYRNSLWALRFQHSTWRYLCDAAKLVLGDCSRKAFDRPAYPVAGNPVNFQAMKISIRTRAQGPAIRRHWDGSM
jgi:hypothetical protein